jgi:putative oxygen-independent coproporphyrinogen III oxidase
VSSRSHPSSRIIPIAVAGSTRAGGSPLHFTSPPPLSLYIHVPWCVRKCPYCDFNSHEARAENDEAAYVAALVADLESALPSVWGRKVSTIFIGGGTPSLLSGEALHELLNAVRMRLPLLPEAEVTLEANPGTAEAGKFAAFRAAGVNRLSLGIQSFNDRHLEALGRIHDSAEARAAIELAKTHFERFNLDLMYGLPQQSQAEAMADLEMALSFAPPHLSCYQLTLEPNTLFAARPPQLPEGDTCADMQDAIEARLAAAGYVHYETSAFARPGYQCRHNLNYWTFGDYLGIGAGAHGKLTLPDHSGFSVQRQMRWKQPKQYLEQVAGGQPVQEQHGVGADELPFEFLMNALRLNQGFDPALFEQRTGLPLLLVRGELEKAAREGLLTLAPDCIAPTERGRRFLNALLERFLPS